MDLWLLTTNGKSRYLMDSQSGVPSSKFPLHQHKCFENLVSVLYSVLPQSPPLPLSVDKCKVLYWLVLFCCLKLFLLWNIYISIDKLVKVFTWLSNWWTIPQLQLVGQPGPALGSGNTPISCLLFKLSRWKTVSSEGISVIPDTIFLPHHIHLHYLEIWERLF